MSVDGKTDGCCIVLEGAEVSSGATLQVGLSLTGLVQQPRDADMDGLIERIVGWVRRARDLGFDYIYTGQHYLTTPYQMLQPIPLLARLAGEVGDMRLVMTVVLPLHHPVSLAETLATLDWITGGRLTVDVARGYRREEFSAFGVRDRQVSARMNECLRCLLALWSGDPVTFHGAHFRLQRAQIGLRPRQRPHPPVWFAANADRGVRRAARLGLPWHVNPHADYTTISRQVELYRSEARRTDEPLPMAREVCCAETSEEARTLASRYLDGKYAVIGSPDECAAELRRYVELGVGALHPRLVWPGMPAELASRSLELFAERVVPQLRASVSPPD